MTAVTVLAPAFNERAVIERFVTEVMDVLQPDWELLIVDDGSTDGTALELTRLEAQHQSLRLVTHASNRGLGSALITGFAAARGDIVVTMDADLSHPLGLLPELVERCTNVDAVFASRFVRGGGMPDVGAARAIVSRVANAVIRRLLGVPVRDMTTGYRAYRREALTGLELRGGGFETQLEITVRLVQRGARIAEVPLILGQRAAGLSKMHYLPLVPHYGRMVLRMMRLRWFGRESGLN